MEEIIEQIVKFGIHEIDLLFDVVMKRKRELYPKWELIYIALPKENNQERKDTIKWIYEMLSREQEGH